MKSKIIHTLKQCKFGLKVIILLFIYIQKMNYKNIFPFFAVVAALAFSACSDGKSYADLLNDENKYVNSFLVWQRVEGSVPADTMFEVGYDAPYYQLDDEGNVFMQVLSVGDGEKAEDNQMVYFRFMRYSLSYYEHDTPLTGEGNADNMAATPTWFRYNNFTNSQSANYGEGLQMPLRYLPLNSKVNVVIKSQMGWYSEISYVTPYLYTVSYYKSQI